MSLWLDRKRAVNNGGLLLPTAILSMALAIATPGSASDDANSCLSHIAREEAAHSIPKGLLESIGVTESGRMSAEGKPIPWPWTVNATGAGQFFESKEGAIEFVQELLTQGVTVIDVGCMQVNLYFHPNAFESLDAAFDPATNVAYAAEFLKELGSETDDWEVATQYYHSRTSYLGQAYSERVKIAGVGSTIGTVGAVTHLSRGEKAALRAEAPDLLVVSDGLIATSSNSNRSNPLLKRQSLTASMTP